ncbi:hypothetical protein AB833_22830 [Chromatiales bacterium (ex Bugula neritina AB1)]|nr:hypothetical protein AB833_22830 [Chromatiales bacterium (ex Bugula neritina AB1)]
MAAIVLVHGAWSGAHGFRKVRPLLRAADHDVFTPSLTGIGERVHLANPLINLTTHIHDVVNTILYEDLKDIVLVGFSYGGMVVSGALQHIGDRVQHLVYLDAFVPADGQSANDLRGSRRDEKISIGREWVLNPASRSLDDPSDTEWYGPRRTSQPGATFAEPVSLSAPLEQQGCSLSYIKAVADETETPDSAFWRAARAADASPQWNYFEVETNHMVAINRPGELAAILLTIAG